MSKLLSFLLISVFMVGFSCASPSLKEEDKMPQITLQLLDEGVIQFQEIDDLKTIINQAYLKGEEGICLPDMQRTNNTELVELIKAQSLIGLWVNDKLQGCVRVSQSPYDEPPKAAMFGMLVVKDDPSLRGKGYGSLLVSEAEHWARKNGYQKMILEFLMPKKFVHGHKMRLLNWYTDIGYEFSRSVEFHAPEVLLPHLRSPENHDFAIYVKELK